MLKNILKNSAEFMVTLMLTDKTVHVYVIGAANEFYLDLKQKVEQELLQNKTDTFLQTLFKSIENKKEEIKKTLFTVSKFPKN